MSMAARRFATAAAAASALASSRRAAPAVRRYAAVAAASASSSFRRSGPAPAAVALTRLPSAAATYRGGSLTCTRPLSQQAGTGFWSYPVWRDSLGTFVENAKKADDFIKVIYAAHGIVWFACTGVSVVAIWYVESRVKQEATKREEFQTAAVKGHQDFVQSSLDSQMKTQNKIDLLNDKMDGIRHQMLADKEADMRYRHVVTAAAEELRRNGYLMVSELEFQNLLKQVKVLSTEVVNLKNDAAKNDNTSNEQQRIGSCSDRKAVADGSGEQKAVSGGDKEGGIRIQSKFPKADTKEQEKTQSSSDKEGGDSRADSN